MELRESIDRRLKSENNYERYNNTDEHVEFKNHSSFIYQLPVPKSRKKNGLMLELDASNANWLVAASAKKYVPVGVANSVEAATVALTQLRAHKAPGYIVVADENELPFQHDLFDLVWRFSPYKLNSENGIDIFVERTSQVMAKSGILKIALDHKQNGLANKKLNGESKSIQQVTSVHKASFHHQAFSKQLAHVHITIRSCFGALALKRTMQSNLSARNMVEMASKAMAFLSGYIPAINRLSESIFLNARKDKGSPNFRIHHFLKHHWLRDNLNIVYLLQCPISGGPVYLSKDSNFVISDLARVKYPVINEIPLMLKRAAIEVEGGNKSSRESFKLMQG